MEKKNIAWFMVLVLVIAMGGITLWGGLAAEAVDSNSGVGTLNVVHGIPDAQVDVCASGETTGGEFTKVLTEFNFEQIRVLELPEGDYDARVVSAGDDCSNPLPGLSATGLSLTAGANVSVIAHLTEGGEEFQLTVGVNENSQNGFGASALVTVYHVAAAPRVDIRAGRTHTIRELFTFVGNGEFGAHEIRPGSYQLAIVPAGEPPTEAVATAELTLDAGSNTLVYAVGSLSEETFTLLSQVIPLEEMDTGQ